MGTGEFARALKESCFKRIKGQRRTGAITLSTGLRTVREAVRFFVYLLNFSAFGII